MNPTQHKRLHAEIAAQQPISRVWHSKTRVPVFVCVGVAPTWLLAVLNAGIVVNTLLVVAAGAGVALGLMNIGHDGMHHQLFASRRLSWFVMWITSAGSGRQWWMVKHNLFHHSGLPGSRVYEPPLSLGLFARLAEDQPWRPWHRWQWLYFWPVLATQHLSMMAQSTVFSITGRFMGQRHGRAGLRSAALRVSEQWVPVLLVVAVALRNHRWWSVALTLLAISLIAGTVASAVLLVEVVERAHSAAAATNGWADSQLAASMSINRSSRSLTWLTGALNLHSSHHLFPTLPAHRLPQIDVALHRLAEEEGFAVSDLATYRQSWLAFGHHLHEMGQSPVSAAVR